VKLNNITEFIEVIRDNTKDYEGPHQNLITNAAYLYDLIYELLKREAAPKKYRIYLIAAIGYFSITEDVIPAFDFGISGYYDDIYLCCYVIKKLLVDIDYEDVYQYWNGSISLKTLLYEDLDELSKELGHYTQRILDFVGIE
jgi:uncharacterized membrane protein YkvA (DUF1232 family)